MTMTIKKLREWLLPSAVLLLAAAMTLPLLIGWHSYIVLSGSMEPHYPVGSLVYIMPTPADNLVAGAVVAFEGVGGTTVTHRIVSVDLERELLITKGDANQTNDPVPVSFDNVLGKVMFCLPLAGYLSLLLRSPAMILMLSVAAGGWLALLLWKKLATQSKEG